MSTTYYQKSQQQLLPWCCIFTVLTVFVQTTYGQSYFLSLSHNQRAFYNDPINLFDIKTTTTKSPQPTAFNNNNNNNNSSHNINNNTEIIFAETLDDRKDLKEDNSTTIVFIKNIRNTETTELSQTAMDVITIVWYVATFLALAAFFLLMACSDRRCQSVRQHGANRGNTHDMPIPPPTPSPSYSEFAPPSYETVMKMQQHAAATRTASIFIIPYDALNDKETTSNNTTNNNNNIIANNGSATTTPPINFYTVNEVQKL